MADRTKSPIVSFSNSNHFISVKLTTTNYLFWKTQITLFLEGHDLIGFVDGTLQRPSPTDPNYAHWVQQDKLIMSFLIASLSEDIFLKVIDSTETSLHIWIALEKALASKSNMAPHRSYEQDKHGVTPMDHILYISIQTGDFEVLRRSENQLNVQLTPYCNTLLHVLAQFHDNAECVKKIFVLHSSALQQSLLTWKNSKDQTALHIAAKKGRFSIVRALIDHAKSLDREELESNHLIAEKMMRTHDRNGDIALHLAVRNSHPEVVKLLVEEDPDFQHPSNIMEETPLYLAVESNNCGLMVDSFLKTCTSPTYRGPDGKTALHVAVIKNCKDCSGKLVKQMEHISKEVDNFGWSPLHYAARFGFITMATQLLEVDRFAAYIMAPKDDYKTPLHVATGEGNIEVMIELLKHCPDCWEMTTSKGQNVLHLAVDYEEEEVLNFIVSNTWAENLINEKDDEGNTPLHLYATTYSLNGRSLVKHSGVDKNVFNRKNLTPLEVIENSESYIYKEEIKRMKLKQAGEKQITSRNIIQKDFYDNKKRKDWIAKEERVLPYDIRKQGETNLIVAALVATVTFAAGFTVPGGYNGNEGSNQGRAILAKKNAFRLFVLGDSIALVSSIMAVFLLFMASSLTDRRKIASVQASAQWLILAATFFMMFAFMSGLYVALPTVLGVMVLLCCSEVILFWVIYRLFLQRIMLEITSGNALGL